MILPTVAQAARNNALWCDAVCRAHGAPGEFHPRHWLNRLGTPRFYPDAVTLEEAAEAAPVLALRHQRGAVAVKDSFRRLDLAAAGFARLFDAEWLAAPAPAGVDAGWRRVGTEAGLSAWERAWAGDGAGPRIFLPALLADPDIAFIAVEREGRLAGGGILNRGARVVGLSNGFAAGPVRRSLMDAAGVLFPGLPLVGYAAGEKLAGMLAVGFAAIGGLRVWQSAAP